MRISKEVYHKLTIYYHYVFSPLGCGVPLSVLILKSSKESAQKSLNRATNLTRLQFLQEEKIQNLTVRLAFTHRELKTLREKADGLKNSSSDHFSNIWKAVNKNSERTENLTNKVRLTSRSPC